MSDSNPLPLVSAHEISPIPTFSCHVILTPPQNGKPFQGRTANLEGIQVEAATERDVLMAIMERFRTEVRKHTESGQEIPFVDPPEEPGAGELVRFIPIHL